MNKEDNFIEELFGKTEETKPTTTEIVSMAVNKIVPNLKNPYKYREKFLDSLE